MKTFITLFKTALNIHFGISALKYRITKEKKRLWEPILIGISALFGIGTLMVMISLFMYGLFTAGKLLNKPELVLTLSLVGGQLVILIFGIFLIIGSFYFAKDLNILIPLPLKPSQVLGSKFAVIMFSEYLILFLFMVPSFIIYGTGTDQSFIYWVKSMVVFLTMPAIPLLIGAFFVLLLMRFVNVRKSKDLLTIVGGFFGLLAAVGFNFFFQRMPKGNEQEFIDNLMATQSKIIESIGQKFPPSLWATYGITKSGTEGLAYLFLFIAVSVLLYIALMWLGNRVFYRSFVSGQETVRKRRILTEKQGARQKSAEASPVMALFRKEWKLFIRTPIYVMNGIFGMVLAPFLVIMPFIADKEVGKKMLMIMENPGYSMYISLGALGIMLFGANLNIIANTSISREGQMFWISKMIPVSPKYQVLAKIFHCVAVEAIGIAIAGIVLIAFLNVAITKVLILFVIAVLASVLLIVLNLMIDVIRPKLEWTNPQEAVKRNINGLIGILLTMFMMGILFGISMLLIFLGLSEGTVYLSLIVITVLLTIPSAIGLFALAEHRYSKLET
ncbi:MAG: hypothetical protein N3I35_00140 [Clostridia bacterium]|nr:hypothetical protein [Clostridia bacterium]